MPSASDGSNATEAPKRVQDSLLSSLRQQLEARRSVLGVGNSRASAARAQEQLQSTVDEDPAGKQNYQVSLQFAKQCWRTVQDVYCTPDTSLAG